MTAPESWAIGAAPRRREDERLIRGRGRFVADIDLPGQLHCVFVRSPHAHARLGVIDAAPARSMPGVRAVFTGADMARAGVGPMRSLWLVNGSDGPALEPQRWGLARERVRHVGEAVALVIADTRGQAEDAAGAILPAYDPLAALAAAPAALAPGAPRLHELAPANRCYRYERGDHMATDAAFAGAAHVTRLRLISQRVAGCALEPRAVLADPRDAAARLTLYSSTQVPHHIRQLLGEQLAIAAERIRVIAPDVGGGFGYKGKYTAEEAVLAWAALHLGAPLKWVATRSESFIADLQGRDHVTDAALALDRNGGFLALEVRTLVNLGAYVSTMGTAISSVIYSSLLSGMYRLPVMHAEVIGAFTNTLPTDAYRGAGRPEACYVLERLADRAARELQLDRAELRRRNLVPAHAMPYATSAGPVYDCGDFPRVFERALVLADYANLEARRAAAGARGKALGLGIACYVESSGVGPTKMARAAGARVDLHESAEIRVAADGRITVLVGTHGHGQGHETAYTQILNARLGIGHERIEIIEGDTGRIPEGAGTFGSRSIAVGGSALALAADAIIARGKRLAAPLLGADCVDVSFDPTIAGGAFSAHGRSLDFAELARSVHAEAARATEQDTIWSERAVFAPATFAYSNGVHACEVEVDSATGTVNVVRYSAVDDVGNVINPMLAQGQLHGGVAQGLGQALKEACIYDAENGQLLTGSFMDYGLPRSHDAPRRFDGESDQSQPTGFNPLGAKGAGEAGAIAAPAALVNAVLDALRPVGVTDLEMPLTPARVWAAIRRART